MTFSIFFYIHAVRTIFEIDIFAQSEDGIHRRIGEKQLTVPDLR